MFLKTSIFGLLILGCWGIPVPDPQSDPALGSALNAAGASQDKYSCECHVVPSDDGIRTLQCHCTNKNSAEGTTPQIIDNGGLTATPSGNLDNTPGSGPGAGTDAPAGTPGPEAGTPGPGAGVNGTDGQAGTAGPQTGTPGPGAGVNGTDAPTEGAGGATNGTGTDGGAGGASNGTAPLTRSLKPNGGDDKFFGDTTAYVACLRRAEDTTDNSVKPDWDWLHEEGKSVQVPGKWIKTQCAEGVQDTFQVSPSTYKETLEACVRTGYQVAQPANFGVSSYYAFQIASNVQEHFNREQGWIHATTYTLTKESEVGKCSAASTGSDNGNSTDADTPFGDAKTYVACLKRGNGLISSAPDWEWLKTDEGKNVRITGKWISYGCSYGKVSAFNVREKSYNEATSRCKERGFEVAQPADNFASGYYAFHVGADLKEYYSEEKGWVKNGYTRRPSIGSEKC